MIFRDGFFHADLHPGNLIIFKDASVGFIDLGMVGRFEHETQAAAVLLFLFVGNGRTGNAARYLASLSLPVKNSDVEGFRRAVAGLYGRWLRSPNFKDFLARPGDSAVDFARRAVSCRISKRDYFDGQGARYSRRRGQCDCRPALTLSRLAPIMSGVVVRAIQPEQHPEIKPAGCAGVG